MMRTFNKGDKVRLKSEAMYSDCDGMATVVLVSPNQVSLGFEFNSTTALRHAQGGLFILDFLGVTQSEDGKLTDLFGNCWEVARD